MTPLVDTLDLDQRQAWASSWLGLSESASPQEVRAAVLEHLDDAGLTPSTADRHAILVLCDPDGPASWPDVGNDPFHDAREDELTTDVEVFFAEFFLLSCNARRQRWTELLELAMPHPRIRWRLRPWERGLDVAPEEFDIADAQEKLIAQRVGLLFLLKPGDRTGQRRRWLAEMTGDWTAAARRFHRNRYKLALLDVDFVRALESSGSGAGQLTFAEKEKLAPALVAAPQPASAPKPARKFATTGANDKSSNRRWLWFVLAFLAFFRYVLPSLTDPSPPNYQYHPTVPTLPPTIPVPRNFGQPRYRDDSSPDDPSSDKVLNDLLQDYYRTHTSASPAKPTGDPAPPEDYIPRSPPTPRGPGR